MKYRIFALMLGLGLIVLRVFSLIYYRGISYPTSSTVGWDCPFGGCSPGPNSMGMEITYPKVIELTNSKPIYVWAYIFELQPSGLNCPKPVITIESIDYEAQLSTAGIDVSPESIQTFKDNNISDGSSSEWTWIVYPKIPGTYTFYIRTSATTQDCQLFNLSDTFEIQVVDIFGLTALQLRMTGFISGFLGSALTLPGILAIWAKLKENRADTKRHQDSSSATIIVSASGKEKNIKTTKSKDSKKRDQ